MSEFMALHSRCASALSFRCRHGVRFVPLFTSASPGGTPFEDGARLRRRRRARPCDRPSSVDPDRGVVRRLQRAAQRRTLEPSSARVPSGDGLADRRRAKCSGVRSGRSRPGCTPRACSARGPGRVRRAPAEIGPGGGRCCRDPRRRSARSTSDREGRAVAAGERDVVDGEAEALDDRLELGPEWPSLGRSWAPPFRRRTWRSLIRVAPTGSSQKNAWARGPRWPGLLGSRTIERTAANVTTASTFLRRSPWTLPDVPSSVPVVHARIRPRFPADDSSICAGPGAGDEVRRRRPSRSAIGTGTSSCS